MSKQCYICGEKLNMMNSVIMNDKKVCMDCSCLLSAMIYSEDIDEIKNIVSKLSKRTSNDDAKNFVLKIINKYFGNISTFEELLEYLRQEEEQEQERERKIYQEEQKHKHQEEERRRKFYEEEQERKRKEQEDLDAFLKENGHQGYYEYKVVSLYDDDSGSISIEKISNLLNSLGREGWHIKCAYANELGRNSNSSGAGGFSSGTNSTIDQNIIILERFIKFK